MPKTTLSLLNSIWTLLCVLVAVSGVQAQTPNKDKKAAAPATAATSASAAASSASSNSPRKTAVGPGCSVADFRTLTLDTHMPAERHQRATQWLSRQGPNCNEEQILAIRANRALWMGAADSVALMGMVDRLIEAKQTGRPELLQGLYSSPQPEQAERTEVTLVRGGTRPIVPPPPAPMMPGVQIQANMPVPNVQPMPGQFSPGAPQMMQNQAAPDPQ